MSESLLVSTVAPLLSFARLENIPTSHIVTISNCLNWPHHSVRSLAPFYKTPLANDLHVCSFGKNLLKHVGWAWWCWWGCKAELCSGYIGGARVELGNMADSDGHMIDLVETYDEDDVLWQNWLHWSSFVDDDLWQNWLHWLHWSSFVVQTYICTMQIHVADVKFVLLHVHDGQVLRWAVWDCRTLWIRNCETESSCPRMRVLYLCLLINCAIILYLFAQSS